MFFHRMSLVGYGLGAFAVIAAALNTFVLVDYGIARSIMLFLAIGCSVFDLSTVFLGVIARGFERVEAAIRVNADDL